MTKKTSNSASSTPQPALPLQLTWSSVLSQDVVSTDTIPVDSESPSPVGPFPNPNSMGVAGNVVMEALVIAQPAGQPAPVLCHVARNTATDAGWVLNPLFGGVTADLVAAGTAFAGTSAAAVYALYQDSNGLNFIQLQADGVTWSQPRIAATAAAAALQVAYSPAGAMIVYGPTAGGDLLTIYQAQIGGPFTGSVTSMQGGLAAGGCQLSMQTETTWQVASVENGAAQIYTGVLGASEYASVTPQQFPVTLEQAVVSYWSNATASQVYLFVDSTGTLQSWAQGTSGTAAVQAIPNATVVSATGHVASDNTLHVYSIDKQQNLWVLHQDPNTPWNPDGSPNWSPYIPIDSQIAGVICDSNPADSPTLFALDASDFSLRLHAQDPQTDMWSTVPVRQAAAEAFEVVRYRAEATLLDANSCPVPLYPMTLGVAPDYSATDVWIAGQVYPVNSLGTAAVATDALGKLTMVIASSGLSSPALVVNADGLPNAFTVQPALPVHTYLSGQGVLNPSKPGGPNPVFDGQGATLASATLNGNLLAPGMQNMPSTSQAQIATAIQNTALIAAGAGSSSIPGFRLRLRGEGGPSFTVLTRPEIDALSWSEIEQWAGDFWAGIENGLIELGDIFVDAANAIAQFTVTIGQDIQSGVNLVIHGLEQAAHFIAGVFQSVAAKIEDVVDWLKALFDFGAIWRTMTVFQGILSNLPDQLSGLLAAADRYTSGWFQQQIATVNNYFATLESNLGSQSFSQLNSWQGTGTTNTTPVAGASGATGASPADFTGNVHHNWLQDKVNSATSSTGIGNSIDTNLTNAFQGFVTSLGDGVKDLVQALKLFGQGILTIIENPNRLATTGIADFLVAANAAVDALLNFADAVVQLLYTLGQAAFDALNTLLNTAIDLPFISSLWNWIASKAGSGPSQLTIGALLALVAAFPTTVVYKLVMGVDQEPFPSGALPPSNSGASADTPAWTPDPVCILTSAILQTLYALPATVGDFLGANCPGWITGLCVVASGVIFFLRNGVPALNTLEWVGIDAVLATLTLLSPLISMIIEAIETGVLMSSSQLSDCAASVMTLYGWGKLILGIVMDCRSASNQDSNINASRILLSLSPSFAWTQISDVRESEAGPFFVAFGVVADLVGYIGGGIALIVDAIPAVETSTAPMAVTA